MEKLMSLNTKNMQKNFLDILIETEFNNFLGNNFDYTSSYDSMKKN